MGRHALSRRPTRVQVQPASAATQPAALDSTAGPVPARKRDISEAKILRQIIVDQANAGASNLAIILMASHALGNSSGYFVIIFTVYSIALGASRALVGDPTLIHPAEARERPGEPMGAAILLGFGLGALILAAGGVTLIWNREFGYALMALSIFIAPLLMQDLGRELGFATKRPGRAISLDSLWLVLVVVGAVGLHMAHTHSLAWFVVVWGGTGAISSVLTFSQNRGFPIAFSIGWIRFTWPFSWRYLISYSANQGASLVGTSAIGAVAGKAALSGVGGNVSLVRVFGMVQIAAVAAGTSRVARSSLRPRQVLGLGAKFSFLTTFVAAINGLILVALPDRIGEAVLGVPVWHAAKPLLWANAAQILCLGVITGARAGMLGMRAARFTVKIDVTTTIVVLAATVIGVAVDGVLGAFWAVGIGQAAMAIVWWSVFRWYTATQPDVPLAFADETTDHPDHEAVDAAISADVADQSSVASLGTRPLRELSPWAAWR